MVKLLKVFLLYDVLFWVFVSVLKFVVVVLCNYLFNEVIVLISLGLFKFFEGIFVDEVL